MSKEAIVERILSDAEREARAILSDAETRAQAILDEANARVEQAKAETEAEIEARAKRISEGKAAAARLDSQKIMLAEKRRVLDEIYSHALKSLLALGERESLTLLERLLEENAETGDTVVFAENFAYIDGAKKLPVVSARKLAFSAERAKIDGGCLLRGSACDKDLSYGALLSADREEHQASIAARIFR